MDGSILVLLIVGAAIVFFFVQKGRSSSVTSLRSSPGIPPEIAHQAKQEALASLVASDNRSKYAAPPFMPADERLVFSVPAVLSENHSTGRRGAGASVRIMKGVWYHTGGSQTTQAISPVDSGTLILTNKRFLFGGSRKSLEFPLAKLTQLSTSAQGIALAKSGREKVSYFTGLHALTITLQVLPKAGDTWSAGKVEFPLTGPDVLQMVQSLKSAH
jgi:hypothetical protein